MERLLLLMLSKLPVDRKFVPRDAVLTDPVVVGVLYRQLLARAVDSKEIIFHGLANCSCSELI